MGSSLSGPPASSDDYAAQNQTVLTGDLQEFSFLHRSFVFKRDCACPSTCSRRSAEASRWTVPR
jgi:hypothetical protein